jgi:hypothetical protein
MVLPVRPPTGQAFVHRYVDAVISLDTILTINGRVHGHAVAQRPPAFRNDSPRRRCTGRHCLFVHDSQRVLYRNLIATLPYH